MDLYLVADGPSHLHFVSANAVPHYLATTYVGSPNSNGLDVRMSVVPSDDDCSDPRQHQGPPRNVVTVLQRPLLGTHNWDVREAPSVETEGTLAEIRWASCGRDTKSETSVIVPRSELPASGGPQMMKAIKILYKKKTTFAPKRYFRGDDGLEYEWRKVKPDGFKLTQSSTEVARTLFLENPEGLFASRLHEVLRVQPDCLVDIDMVVLTFLVISRKRLFSQLSVVELETQEDDEDPSGDAGDSGDDGDELDGEGGVMVGEA